MATLAEIAARRVISADDAHTSAEVDSAWMQPLTAQARDTVRRNVAAAPDLTDRQRERLRLLFRQPIRGGITERETGDPPR